MDHVLVLDDEDIGGEYRRTLEQSIGVRVEWVRNEEQALKAVTTLPIKVAIIDQRLSPPELGTDIWKKMHKLRPDIVPIMLTGQAEKKEIFDAGHDFFRFLEKKSSDLSRLPLEVAAALQEYGLQLARSTDRRSNSLLFQRRKWFIGPTKLEIYEIATIVVDEDYVFVNEWKERFHIAAGQKFNKETISTIENEVHFEERNIEEISLNYKLGMDMLKSKISNEFHTSSKFETTTKTISKVKQEVRENIELQIPQIPADPSQRHLISKSYQETQVYVHTVHLLQIFCEECKGSHYYPVAAYYPTVKLARRQVNSWSDGIEETVETGIVTPSQ